MHPPMMGSQHQHPPSAKNMEWDCCGWGGRRDPGDGEGGGILAMGKAAQKADLKQMQNRLCASPTHSGRL